PCTAGYPLPCAHTSMGVVVGTIRLRSRAPPLGVDLLGELLLEHLAGADGGHLGVCVGEGLGAGSDLTEQAAQELRVMSGPEEATGGLSAAAPARSARRTTRGPGRPHGSPGRGRAGRTS